VTALDFDLSSVMPPLSDETCVVMDAQLDGATQALGNLVAIAQRVAEEACQLALDGSNVTGDAKEEVRGSTRSAAEDENIQALRSLAVVKALSCYRQLIMEDGKKNRLAEGDGRNNEEGLQTVRSSLKYFHDVLKDYGLPKLDSLLRSRRDSSVCDAVLNFIQRNQNDLREIVHIGRPSLASVVQHL
jgi:hypothetical protein